MIKSRNYSENLTRMSVKWKGFGRMQSWHNRDTIPEFVWRVRLGKVILVQAVEVLRVARG
jgi:hypothetical protein